MPQMDGWELAFLIKALKPEVPIVAFTGDSPDVILPRIPDSEINQALFKPIRIEVLGDAISAILPSEMIRGPISSPIRISIGIINRLV